MPSASSVILPTEITLPFQDWDADTIRKIVLFFAVDETAKRKTIIADLVPTIDYIGKIYILANYIDNPELRQYIRDRIFSLTILLEPSPTQGLESLEQITPGVQPLVLRKYTKPVLDKGVKRIVIDIED